MQTPPARVCPALVTRDCGGGRRAGHLQGQEESCTTSISSSSDLSGRLIILYLLEQDYKVR